MNRFTLFFIMGWLVMQGCTNQPSTAPKRMAEQHRPQFHFSPQEKWMNDPNGMVYYEGEYHLFFQYYPDSTVWGPMHWGHAVSTDLVHWEHLPIGLYPDSLGYIFSGSAVVDWKNTSGFGTSEEPPLIAIFTHHDPAGDKASRKDFQYQSIAYSTDKGRTWTKYAGNPVVPNPGIRDFRDPKVIWHDASQRWIMVFAAWDHVKFYGSPDLKSWEHLSDFGREWGSHAGVWECPDLFPLQVEGTDEQRWVLLLSINPGSYNGGSGTQYFVGDFDGTTFTLDQDAFAEAVTKKTAEQAVWLDYGRDNYAGVTWSDVPTDDGRRIFMGWMSNWDYAQVVPTKKWRSAMTLPRTLTLAQTGAGLRVLSRPVKELEKLRATTKKLEPSPMTEDLDLAKQLQLSSTLLEIEAEVELRSTNARSFGIELSNSKGERYRVGYSFPDNTYFSDRTAAGKIDFSTKFASKPHLAPRWSTNPTLTIQLFVDVASAELFADEGSTVLTDIFFPNEDFNQVKWFVEGGTVDLKELTVHELTSIW